MEFIIDFLDKIAWPATVVTIVVLFRNSIAAAMERVAQIEFGGDKGMKLVLHKLDKQKTLPLNARTELAGLTSNEIWALQDFETERISFDGMNAAQKVAVRVLLDARLLEKIIIDGKENAQITQLGKELLQAANSILVDEQK